MYERINPEIGELGISPWDMWPRLRGSQVVLDKPMRRIYFTRAVGEMGPQPGWEIHTVDGHRGCLDKHGFPVTYTQIIATKEDLLAYYLETGK